MNRNDPGGKRWCRALLMFALIVMTAGCATTDPAPSAGTLTAEEIAALPAPMPVPGTEPESDSETLAELRAVADNAYRRADYTTAARYYLPYLRSNSDDVEAWFRLSNAYAASGRFEDAVRGYQVVLGLDPEHARARHNYGLISVEVGVQALLEARLKLPRVDSQAEGTIQYLDCLMATLHGRPQPAICGDRRPN